MYTPPVFRTDDATAWEFVRWRGFGAVVAVQDGIPIASHVPFLADVKADGKRLTFHVARANPLAEVITKSPRVLAIVPGPDSYISPDWYETPTRSRPGTMSACISPDQRGYCRRMRLSNMSRR